VQLGMRKAAAAGSQAHQATNTSGLSGAAANDSITNLQTAAAR
jgi:hypothetical protein